MTDEPRILGGRYELGVLLGRGGMAEVRRAKDLRLGRAVAVKQLRLDLATDSTFLTRFRREAQAAAGLNHPNIVSVYDTGEEPDPVSGITVPYIVMELVEGHTLRDILRDGRKILPERALEFTQGVLDALSFSHRAGIVHRDIKPANVMLTRAGTVKVMDFGIARAVADTSATMTQTAAVIGTAQYLSPEQARGETVDARSDIYSAGCLLYELLVGRPPFVGDSPVSVAYQHVREQPVPPSSLDDLITPEMDAITLKALAKKPEDRYQTAAEMRHDITRLLTGQPVMAVSPSPIPDVVPTQALPVAPTTSPTGIVSPDPAPAAPPTLVRSPARASEAPPPPVRKTSRSTIALGVLAGLVAIALIAVAVVLFAQPRSETVQVPSVLSFTQAVAEQAIKDAKLTPKVQHVAGVDDNSVGTVIRQDPVANTKVEVGSIVTVTVNDGPKKGTIPAGVVGRQVKDAQAVLKAAGFTNVVTAKDTTEPASAKENQVTRVNPAEGASVTPDKLVTLYYASGQSSVPNLMGLDQAGAIEAARLAGFTNLTWANRESTQPKGTVVGQDPEPNTLASRSDPIKVYLAVPPAIPTQSSTPASSSTPPTTPKATTSAS